MYISNLASDSEEFTGNVWLLEASDEKVLIDVGEGDCWESIKEVEEVDKVVITHSHHDHVDNLEKVMEKFVPDFYAFEPSNLQVEAFQLSEGEKIELCGEMFEVFHTPGHKDDSICLYSESGILFTGDLVFPSGAFGRTDLDEGDRDKLINSIEKIVELDADSFYSGHGEAVTKNANEHIELSLKNARKKQPKY